MVTRVAIPLSSNHDEQQNAQWKDTHHTAVGLAGPKGSDHERNVQVGVNPPALVAALQTADIILQLSLVQLVDQVSLRRQATRVRPPQPMFTGNSTTIVRTIALPFTVTE